MLYRGTFRTLRVTLRLSKFRALDSPPNRHCNGVWQSHTYRDECHTEALEVLRAGVWKYFRFDEVFSPAHCRGGYYFSLDRKVAKDQDGKNLLPARPAPGPVFRRAFARFFSFCHCEEERRGNLVAVLGGLTSGTLMVYYLLGIILNPSSG